MKKVVIFLALICLVGCSKHDSYQNITGVSAQTNQQIKSFLIASKNVKGRKVATFDMDGTVIGQVPYYLADESLYAYALKHPNYKTKLIQQMAKESNTSKKYVAERVKYFAGLAPQQLEQIGDATFARYYSDKIFPEVKQLIANLKQNGFEVWVVSASPEFLYQDFVAKQLGIPVTHIIGIKSVVKNGVTTDQIIPPVAQQDGKPDAIATIIKAKPLVAVGNSKDDFEMLESSQGLRIIINPDNSEPVKKLGGLTLVQYARQHNWLIIHTNDVPESQNSEMASKLFHIRVNKANRK